MGRGFLHALRLQPHAHPGGDPQAAGRVADARRGTLSGNRSPHAYEVARKTSKTCFLFKILAAGRRARSPEELDKAFKEAFDNIKPQDCIVVGMFPRFQDQIKDNCDRVRRILNYSA